jgi:hypothetical protein
MSTVRCRALFAFVFLATAKSIDSHEPNSEAHLLPKAPEGFKAPWRPSHSVEDVPEVWLEEMFNESRTKEMADKHIADLLERIRRLDRSRPDGFVAAIKKHRPDLAGLPFRVGKDTEMNPVLCKHFPEVSTSLAEYMHPNTTGLSSIFGVRDALVPTETVSRSSVAMYETSRSPLGLNPRNKPAVKSNTEFLAGALLAKQRLFALNAEGRMALVQLLQATPLSDVNALLAQVALFAPEPDIRAVALQALSVRRDADYGAVFLEGLKYPLPSIANNAADAIIKLEMMQLAPSIAEMLDDLKGPIPATVDGRLEVPEVVKINHARNCVLCHSPASLSSPKPLRPTAFAALVPNPMEPLPSIRPYYGNDDPSKSIRFDVTYLRPDFSLLMAVEGHYAKWPKQQRFDFIVRTRVLRPDEAAAFEAARPFLPRSPNREAALRALRELTGEDAGDSSKAWIEVLKELTAV